MSHDRLYITLPVNVSADVRDDCLTCQRVKRPFVKPLHVGFGVFTSVMETESSKEDY